ncbi:hypothetical protein B7P43_G07478 [Cryptotermes secundus]|uniref:Uncharacterized protein n=1 Tax=Cryptotermes secundus TaxID=105785 RepID=A0A2J7PI04_9NEOP|nr:hypothetical protein B7P43_G07478 [Cryptotermes secundus]
MDHAEFKKMSSGFVKLMNITPYIMVKYSALLHIRKVPDLNITLETGYPDRGLS